MLLNLKPQHLNRRALNPMAPPMEGLVMEVIPIDLSRMVMCRTSFLPIRF